MDKYLEKARTLMSFELPLTIQEKMVFVFKDGDDSNWSPKNVSYWFKDGPEECPFALGHYYIPGFSRYAVASNGDVVRVRDGCPVNWYNFSTAKEGVRGGYKVGRLISDFGGRIGTSRHRVLLLTFKPLTEHPALKIVNHINGVGGDDRLENLEWCTHSENVKHAYDSGLHSNKLRPVDVTNWRTGETHSCRSVTEAVQKTGLTFNNCVQRLRVDNTRRYADGWRVKEPDQAWLPLNERVGQSICERPVVFLNPVTGRSEWCYSVADAATKTGVAAGTVAMHCGRKVETPTFGFYFRYVDEFGGWPTFTEQQIAIFKEYPHDPRDGIEVYDTETNETRLFTHPQGAADHFELSLITVLKLARYEGVRQRRYKFKLVRVRNSF